MCEISKKWQFRDAKTVKKEIFDLLKSAEIDFTLNQSSRKIVKFPHCASKIKQGSWLQQPRIKTTVLKISPRLTELIDNTANDYDNHAVDEADDLHTDAIPMKLFPICGH